MDKPSVNRSGDGGSCERFARDRESYAFQPGLRDCREGGDTEFSILNRQNLLVLVNFITADLRGCLV